MCDFCFCTSSVPHRASLMPQCGTPAEIYVAGSMCSLEAWQREVNTPWGQWIDRSQCRNGSLYEPSCENFQEAFLVLLRRSQCDQFWFYMRENNSVIHPCISFLSFPLLLSLVLHLWYLGSRFNKLPAHESLLQVLRLSGTQAKTCSVLSDSLWPCEL